MGRFSTIQLMSLEKTDQISYLYENFIIDVFMERKFALNFRSHPSPYLEPGSVILHNPIRGGGDLHSPNALVTHNLIVNNLWLGVGAVGGGVASSSDVHHRHVGDDWRIKHGRLERDSSQDEHH